MNTRYGPSHTPYHLSSASSTTASNSFQPLTHLPSQSSPFQYLSPSTQHSSTFQQRQSSVTAAYGQVLQSPSLQVAAASPASLTGTTSYHLTTGQQRPSTMSYNVGYNNAVSTTAPSTFTPAQQMHPPSALQPSPSLTNSQTPLFSSQETSTFGSPQISQQQQLHWNSPGFQ